MTTGQAKEAALAIVTPTYSVDYDVFTQLRRSVERFAPPDTIHYLIVPEEDVALFSSFRGPNCVVWSARELLVSRIRLTPWLSRLSDRLPRVPSSARVVAIEPRHPLPPVRGWILQQVLKLAAADRLSADTILVADSDVELIRPLQAETFRHDGHSVLLRRENAVTEELPDHVRWHRSARALLGLPAQAPPFHDYISAFVALDGDVVRRLRDHLEQRHGMSWQQVMARQLNLSEWTLYGVFADEVLGWRDQPERHRAQSLCHEYWGTVPMRTAAVSDFAEACRPDDVAMMISAKSRTSMPVRRAVSDLLAPPGTS
ncbi:DUF6492 family protein [Flexivirga sp. B27]